MATSMTPKQAKQTIKSQRRLFKTVHPSIFRDPLIGEECAHAKQLIRQADLALSKRHRKPKSNG